MSNNILVSIENISSCLKSVTDVVKADNFYDTIYCGKYYDRFSVKSGVTLSHLYVLKVKNSRTDRFMAVVDRLSSFNKSPFVSCHTYRDELLCYEGRNDGVYYDIIIVENVEGEGMNNFMSRNINSASHIDIFTGVRSFSSAVLWLFNYKVYIDGFNNGSCVVSQNKTWFTVTEKTDITIGDGVDNDLLQHYQKKLLFAVFASWALLLFSDKDYKMNDVLLDYLESYDLDSIDQNMAATLSAELDETIGSNFSYIIDYVFNGKGDFHASVDCINKSLKIGDDRIEQLCHKMSLSNHYFNSENYDTSYGKSENRVVVRDMKTNKFGYTDSYGNLVIDFIFDEVTHFNEGIAVVGIGKHYYAIDNSGEQLSKKSYDAIQWYSDINRFIVQRGNHYMLLNRAFEQISKHDYIWIGEFSSNRAVVESANNSRKGYIDLDANEITPISYDDALSFENGLGKVLFEGIWHIVTFDGDVI